MYFQLKKPSIPTIRAKFLLEKLRNIPKSSTSISFCATGRTGSGKTTLGNRLVGVDYFMPSTGQQDCTDEVNLVEFPLGLKYFDLPGVCSSDLLENYNRATLGVRQIDDFPIVEEVILAKYGDGKTVQKQKFTISHFRERQFTPDLIFYTIAPHQQFLSADCSYLRDLIKCHQQVIYIFNIFADKESGEFSSATEQNIIDATKRIKKVHSHVLGTENQPIIVPVNCWTGEGISELLTYSYQVLGSQKGWFFEQLIKYQQQKTPDEYLRQIKQEILRLSAYIACQKPDGSYACDRPIHQTADSLWNFLVDSQIQEQISDNITEQVKRSITEIIEGTQVDYNSQSWESFSEKIYSLQLGINSIQEWIEILNKDIKSGLSESQDLAIQHGARAVKLAESEIKTIAEDIESIEQQIESSVNEYNSLLETIKSQEEQIQEHIEKYDSLVNELEYINGKIESRLKEHNTEVDEFNSFAIELSNRIDRYNGRRARLNVRINAFNSTVEEINNSSYRVSSSTVYSLEEEQKSIEREADSLEWEENSLDSKIEQRNRRAREIESAKQAIENMIDNRNDQISLIEREKRKVQKIRESGLSKVKNIGKVEKDIQAQIRMRSEKIKYSSDYREFYLAVFTSFEDEFNSIEQKKSDRLEEINSQITKVLSLVEKYQEKEQELVENDFQYFQEQIDICVGSMWSFQEEIKALINEVQRCTFKMVINKFANQLIMKSTNHYFDNVGQCEYKGSSYEYFRQNGLTFLLTIAHIITSDSFNQCQSFEEMENRYKSWKETISKKVIQLPLFPTEPTEMKIQSLLEANMNLLFYPGFEEPIKKFAL
jgi:hypothetical protein